MLKTSTPLSGTSYRGAFCVLCDKNLNHKEHKENVHFAPICSIFSSISAKWENFIDYSDFNADIAVVQRIPYPPEIPMSRLATIFGLLSLFLCSVGCRLCDTPHDYRIPGYVDRCDDYRGFNPTYRAGSVLSSDWNDACQMVIANACSVGSTSDIFSNAGNYGTTTPISFASPVPGTFAPPVPLKVEQETIDQRTIGVPQHEPTEQFLPEPRRNGIGSGISTVPSVEQLLQQPRGTMPDAMPVIPPTRQRVVPPAPADDTPIETIPFSPSDESIVPPNPNPHSPNPSRLNSTSPHPAPGQEITLEELRRLDPSIHDLEIISIEDASVATPVR